MIGAQSRRASGVLFENVKFFSPPRGAIGYRFSPI
jgi:hypothetical protein